MSSLTAAPLHRSRQSSTDDQVETLRNGRIEGEELHKAIRIDQGKGQPTKPDKLSGIVCLRKRMAADYGQWREHELTDQIIVE